jgi:hypothetical protein
MRQGIVLVLMLVGASAGPQQGCDQARRDVEDAGLPAAWLQDRPAGGECLQFSPLLNYTKNNDPVGPISLSCGSIRAHGALSRRPSVFCNCFKLPTEMSNTRNDFNLHKR